MYGVHAVAIEVALLRRIDHERPEPFVDNRGDERMHTGMAVDRDGSEKRNTRRSRVVLEKAACSLSKFGRGVFELVPPHAARSILHGLRLPDATLLRTSGRWNAVAM